MTARFPLRPRILRGHIDRAYSRTLKVNYPEDVKRYVKISGYFGVAVLKRIVQVSPCITRSALST
jgi:hypothetical protein